MDKGYGILILSVTILVLCFVGAASAGTWYVDDDGGADFTGIQNAIDNASVGDTILVYSGVYYENVVVNKSVTLRGIGHPVVDAGGEGNVIILLADGITLEAFNVINSKFSFGTAGIRIISNNNTITGNNASNNAVGICLDYSRNNNNITGNNVSSNGFGIYLSQSSNNNTITGNKVSNNGDGIWLSAFCNNNIITSNNVSNYRMGIYLGESSNNTITSNNVSNNGDGIRLGYSSNNNIYLNNFINNTDNAYSYQSTNIWNSPLEITYTYDGTTYESYLGNYWDDYNGSDADEDGIHDTTYVIDSDNDNYPLMKRFENYSRYMYNKREQRINR